MKSNVQHQEHFTIISDYSQSLNFLLEQATSLGSCTYTCASCHDGAGDLGNSGSSDSQPN